MAEFLFWIIYGLIILSAVIVAFGRNLIYSVFALMGTFLTSIAGVFFYSVMPVKPELATAPDWLLGLLFGAGGFAGMYCGARMQKYIPQNIIKLVLGLLILSLSLRYILQNLME